jgi:hypothetical protein
MLIFIVVFGAKRCDDGMPMIVFGSIYLNANIFILFFERTDILLELIKIQIFD